MDLPFCRADKVLTLCEMKFVHKLQMNALRNDLERKEAALREAFPGYAVERVLIIGRSVESSGAQAFCNHILPADKLFGV